MTKVEFVKKHVPAEGAKFETSPAFMKITHTCGCILTLSQGGHGVSRHTDEWAELCPHHLEQYEQLKNEQP